MAIFTVICVSSNSKLTQKGKKRTKTQLNTQYMLKYCTKMFSKH